MSTEVILPSPQLSLLDTGNLTTVEAMGLPAVCGPHRGTRRPSGTAESESDSPPPSKKSKKSRRRRKRPRKRCLRRTKPEAPFNTTQFLMEEHDLLQDTDIVARPRRHRDSSFSMDSADESNQFYSSPEDEEEFLTKEFWTAYEDVHAERLDTMTKSQLVQEYLALEEKVDLLERQLRAVRARRRYRIQQQEDDEEDDDVRPGEVRVDPETAQKITIFQSEISNLEVENRKLREENFALRRFSTVRSSSSSSSSSSDSSSSSSSSSSDSSSDSEQEGEEKQEGGKPSVFQDTVVGAVIECQPDSGVSCDSAEAADPPSSSATVVTPNKQPPQVNQSEVEVTSSKCGGDVGVVEEEVSSTTTA